MKENDYNVLDGSPELQKSAVEEFLDELTEEEIARSMSSEFDYLDD